jgi:hypothetical protein
LTTTECCVIIPSKWISSPARLFSAATPLGDHIVPQEQRETAAEQRGSSLFFRSPHRRRPRISAGNAIPAADYFLQKQQKQRELPFIG